MKACRDALPVNMDEHGIILTLVVVVGHDGSCLDVHIVSNDAIAHEIEVSASLDLIEQILFCLRIVLPNCVDFGADVALGTIGTGLMTFGDRTFSNLAQRATEQGFDAIHTAPLAMNMFRKD